MKITICLPIWNRGMADFQSSRVQNPLNKWFYNPVQSKSIWTGLDMGVTLYTFEVPLGTPMKKVGTSGTPMLEALLNPRPAGGGRLNAPPPPLRFFEDSEKTAARSAAVFSLSSKNLRGGAFKRPPPSRARVNVSYKIISSAISNRIKQVLPDVVGNEPTGFIKNRFIGDNTRLTYDLIHYLNSANRSALFLSLDIQDAFNSVSWEFIRIMLQKLHFPVFCIRWFDTLYFEAASLIVYNGHISNRIKLERSCRQGDPLSPYTELTKMYYSTTPVGDKKGLWKIFYETQSVFGKQINNWNNSHLVFVTVHPKQCIKYSVNYLMATSLSKLVSETELTNPKVDNSGEPGTGNKGLLPMLNTRFSALDACLLKWIFFRPLNDVSKMTR